MIATIEHNGRTLQVDLESPLDISLVLRAGEDSVNAFHIPPVRIEPFRIGSFVGDVNQGGSCNVNNIYFNPHGNGTHTECVGHISKEKHSLSQSLKTFHFLARLVSIQPQEKEGDRVITKQQLSDAMQGTAAEAVILRTLPNDASKGTRHYSGTNPPYLEANAAEWLASSGCRHLLLDLPSVDREEDGGHLNAHHAFWKYPEATRTDCTITELIFVPDSIQDGEYLLNLLVASIENDASPSKPVLYQLK
jgi:arylformamidase